MTGQDEQERRDRWRALGWRPDGGRPDHNADRVWGYCGVART